MQPTRPLDGEKSRCENSPSLSFSVSKFDLPPRDRSLSSAAYNFTPTELQIRYIDIAHETSHEVEAVVRARDDYILRFSPLIRRLDSSAK